MEFSYDTKSCVDGSTCEESCNGYTDDEIHQFIRKLEIDQKYIDSLITLCNYISRYVRAGRGLSMKSPLSNGEEKIRGVIYNLIKRKNPNDIKILSSACMDYQHELLYIHKISSTRNILLKIRSETFHDSISNIKKRIREMGVNSDTVPDSTLFARAKDCCDELARQIVMNVIDESSEEALLKLQEKM